MFAEQAIARESEARALEFINTKGDLLCAARKGNKTIAEGTLRVGCFYVRKLRRFYFT